MSRIAVVGGHGQIAGHLHRVLVAQGDEPVAIGRSQEKATALQRQGVPTRFLDIETGSVADFAAVLAGCDAVVFAAGGGPDGSIERKWSVDLEGALKTIAAADMVGIGRYVQISAIGVDEPVAPEASEVWRAYVVAKRDSDIAVRASSLDWTILRPGRLTDDPGTGLVRLGPEVPRGEIPRADVAAVIAAVLPEPGSIGRQWDLVGGDTGVREALQAAVRASA
jgi:uncharacterized protein YbjT (DUF2867 family)